MAAKTAAELVVDIVTDATKATGFDTVAASAGSMESAVKSAGDTAERTGRQIGISADAADELGGKAGKATGALGALSSGFELVGAEKYAGGLQAASMATDFFSGVGDSLNLVMESTVVKTARARVAAIAHSVATKASAVASAAMTGAQWALNAAMEANPVFLIVAGVLLLVGAIVLAYKHSETFRRIVDAAFKAVQRAASFAFTWVKNNWPLLLAILTGPVGLAVLAIVKNFDKIKTAISDVKTWVTNRIGEIPGAIAGFADKIKSTLLAPFTAVEDAIGRILELIKKIHIPHVDLNPLNGRIVAGSSAGTAGNVTTNSYYIPITVEAGISDPYDVAQKIIDLLSRYGIATGVQVSVTS